MLDEDFSDEISEVVLSTFLLLNMEIDQIRPTWLFPPLRCYGPASKL